MKNYLLELGLKPQLNIIVHSSYRKIKNSFPEFADPVDVIKLMMDLITPEGSIIFPAFTYCFKKAKGDYRRFSYLESPSETGALSETFRKMYDTVRTSSPTHSFSLWGKVKEIIDFRNSPASPLGYGSVLDWLAKTSNSYILLLGTDFSSLTFGHYIEIISNALYLKTNPWSYLDILPIGVSEDDEQELIEIPGCSKSFIRFENYLLNEGFITKFSKNGLESCLISVAPLLHYGKDFLKSYPRGFLCKEGTCSSCDERHNYLNSL